MLRQGGQAGSVGETQGLQLGLPPWQRVSVDGCLSISSPGYGLWKTSFPGPGPSNNSQRGLLPSLSPSLVSSPPHSSEAGF